ncbi:MAG: sigma-70 family RNA polymerase sigma factor [Gemmatimonadota bacterium]|nr:sigma-70 family RNA polymerase sigma factor [Gemmatimonadota bacterium]
MNTISDEMKFEYRNLHVTPESDEALIDRALAGDEWAYTYLYRAHRDRVRALVRRDSENPDETEDLVQMVFIKAFLGLADFRGQAAFTTWLTRIALNECANYVRSLKRRKTWLREVEDAVPASQARWLPAAGEDPETAMVRKERREIVKRSINALPERHREAVCLHYLMDRSYDEIAEQLQVPMGTLKVWMYRGRQGLRREVERQGMERNS